MIQATCFELFARAGRPEKKRLLERLQDDRQLTAPLCLATKVQRVIFFPEDTEPIMGRGRLAGHFSTGGGTAGQCTEGRDGGRAWYGSTVTLGFRYGSSPKRGHRSSHEGVKRVLKRKA